MTTTRRSHADCTHPRTAAGRAACRKGTTPAAPSLEQMIADVAMEAEMDSTCPAPINYASFDYAFDSITCWKCSGTGYLPHHAGVHNGQCYPCHGAGKTLTRAGKAAKKAHDAWIADHLMIAPSELRVGMKFKPNQVDGWKTVVEGPSDEEVGGYSITKDDEGNEVRTPIKHITVTTQKTRWALLADGLVQRAATHEERAQLIERIASLKGTILTPR